MSALFSKKKSYKFEINVELEELNSVPFRNAVLFAKLRLVNCRHSSQYSERLGVQNNRVLWSSKHVFQCKMFANPGTSVLESQELKISIRREIKGGKSYHKVGYVSINMACFAAMGGGPLKRRYILEPYNSQKRPDNSMLYVNLAVKLLLGDTCFRVPEEDKSRVIPYDSDLAPSTIPTRSEFPSANLIDLPQDDQEGSVNDTSSEAPSSNHPSLSRHNKYEIECDPSEEQDKVYPAILSTSPYEPPSTISPVRSEVNYLESATWPLCCHCGHMRTSHAELGSNNCCHLDAVSPVNAPPKLICEQHHIIAHPHHHGNTSRASTTSHPMTHFHSTVTERGHQRNPSSVSSIQSSDRSSVLCPNCVAGMSAGFGGGGGPPTTSSGYRTHSRNSSLDSAYQFTKLELQARRGGSLFSCSSNSINNDRSLDRMRERRIIGYEEEGLKQYQIGSTRTDNDQLVNDILRSTTAPGEKFSNQSNPAKLNQHNQTINSVLHRPNSLGSNALPEKR